MDYNSIDYNRGADDETKEGKDEESPTSPFISLQSSSISSALSSSDTSPSSASSSMLEGSFFPWVRHRAVNLLPTGVNHNNKMSAQGQKNSGSPQTAWFRRNRMENAPNIAVAVSTYLNVYAYTVLTFCVGKPVDRSHSNVFVGTLLILFVVSGICLVL